MAYEMSKALILPDTRSHQYNIRPKNISSATNKSLKQIIIGPVIWANTPEQFNYSNAY